MPFTVLQNHVSSNLVVTNWSAQGDSKFISFSQGDNQSLATANIDHYSSMKEKRQSNKGYPYSGAMCFALEVINSK